MCKTGHYDKLDAFAHDPHFPDVCQGNGTVPNTLGYRDPVQGMQTIPSAREISKH